MSRLEGKLQHSRELGIHNKKLADAKITRQYTVGGWLGCAAWILWVAVSFIVS